MASLLGWLGNQVHRAENWVGNEVHGAEQGVQHFVQGAGQQAGQAVQNVGHAVQGAEQNVQQAVQRIAPPPPPDFHIPQQAVAPVQDILRQLQGIGSGAVNPGAALVKAAQNPQVQQAVGQAFHGLSNVANQTGNVINHSPYNPAGQFAIKLAQTHNPMHAVQAANDSFRNAANDFVIRPPEAGVSQIAAQLGHPLAIPQVAGLGGVSAQPSLTQNVAQAKGPLNKGLAVAQDVGNVASLIPVVGGAAKVGVKGAEAVARDLQAGGKLANETGAIGKNVDKLAKSGRADQVAPEKVASFEQGLQKPSSTIVDISPKQALDMNVAGSGKYQPPGVPVKTPSDIRFPVSQLKTLEAQGDAGKALAQKTIDVQTTNDRLGAASEAQIPTVLKIKSKAESHNFQDVLRGKATPINGKVSQAVSEWKSFAPAFRDTGVKAGTRIGDLGPNYFPQKAVFKGDNYQNAIQHLVETGQARDTGEATRLIDEIQSAPNIKKSDYFKKRTLDTGVNHDNVAAVAKNYISQGVKTIAETQHYGRGLGKIDHLIGRVNAEGGDARLARKIMNNLVSPEFSNSPGAKALRSGRSLMSAAKLGTAAISHAGQPLLNDTAHAGITPTLRAYATRYTKANRQLVKDTGVNYNIERQRQLEQSVGSRLSKITAPGLTTVQKFNRGVAAAAGKYKAQALVKKASQGDVKATEFLRNKLGIQGEIGKNLTPEQIIQAGRNEAIATHFSNNPAELPFFHSSELGKTVLQFRAAFGLKETGFIVNEVLKEAKNGNFGPLIRYSIAAPLVGTGIYAGKEAVKNVADDIFNGGKNQSALLPGSVLEAASKGGGFGLPGSIAEGFKYTKNSTGKLDKTKVLEAVAGAIAPLAGEGVKTGANIVDALNGKSQPLVHQGVGEVPVVGSALANMASPYTGGSSQVAPGQPGGQPNTDLTKMLDQQKKDKASDPNQGLQVSDYLTKEQQNFLALTPENQKAYLNSHPEDAYLAKSADEKTAADQIIKGVHPNLPNGLDAQSTKTLTNYERLSTQGKAKYNDSPQNVYDLASAKYQKDLLNGLSPEEQYTRQQALAQDKVKADYGQEVVQLYGFSKSKLKNFFDNNPDKQGLFGQVQDLSSKLADAGLTATDKFAKGLEKAVGKGSRGGSRGGRTRVAKAKIPSFKIAGAKAFHPPKGVKIKAPSFKAPKTRKLSVSKIPKI